jgi:hypothetical protein
MRHARLFIFGGVIVAALCGVLSACSTDDASNANGDSTDGSVNGPDGSTDGANATDGRLADGALVGDGGDGGSSSDAETFGDGACTPRGDGGPFVCGAGAAGTCTDSTTQYCIFGAVPNTCQPLPPACQCEETFSCACLVANLICDDGGVEGVCSAHDDGGLVEAPDAATSRYFWIAAHHCSVR